MATKDEVSRRRTGIGAGALLLTLAVLASACGGSTSSSGGGSTAKPSGTFGNALANDGEPQRGGKLVVAVPAETNGWNPIVNQWPDAGSLVGSSFLEPLTVVDPNGVPQPWLADKWSSNDDFTQWDVSVRPDIKFHNGQPLDGNAVKKNLDAMYQGGLTKVALESQYDHVEVTGPLSVRVYLKHPWSQWPASGQNCWMMAPEMLDRSDQGVLNPIGTGPFVFQDWVQNKSLKVTKNPTYWRKDDQGRQLPFLDEMEFRPITDDGGKEKALAANDVDLALATSAELASRSEVDYDVIKDYTSERTFIMLNTATGDGNKGNPFGNVHARRAVAMATDRVTIAELVGEGVQTTSQGYRPESKWGIPESQTNYPAFDVEKAKAEVEAYKKDTGESTLSFTLTGLTSVGDAKILQTLQDQWKQAGIDAKIETIEQVKYITTIALGLYQAGWFRWYGYLNPDSNYVYNAAEDISPIGALSINFTHFTSPTMQANLEAGRATDDFAKRKEYNDAVVKETNEQALNVWMFDTPYSFIANKKVNGLNGFRQNPFGNFGPKPWIAETWIEK